jgi:hypothetical protein
MSTITDLATTSKRASSIDDSLLYKELSRIKAPAQAPLPSSASSNPIPLQPVDIFAELDAFRVILDDMAMRLETSVPSSQVRFVQDLKALEDNLRAYVGPSPQFEVPTWEKFAAAFSSKIRETLSSAEKEQKKINDAAILTKRDNLLNAIANSALNDKALLDAAPDPTRVLLCIESGLIDCEDLSRDSKMHIRDSLRSILLTAKPASTDAKKVTTDIAKMAARNDNTRPESPSAEYPYLSSAITEALSKSALDVTAIQNAIVKRLEIRYPALVPESLAADPIALQSWVSMSMAELSGDSRVAPLDKLTTDTLATLRDALVQSALQLVPNSESMSFPKALKKEMLLNLAKLSTPTGSSPERPATRDEAIQMAFDKYAASGVQGQFLAASANLHDVKALQTSVLAAIDTISNDITNGFPNSYAQLALKTAQAVSAAWGYHRTFISAFNGLPTAKGDPKESPKASGPGAVSSAAQVVQIAGQLKPFVDGRLNSDRSLMEEAISRIVDAYEKALSMEYKALQGSKDDYFEALDRYMNTKMLLDVQRHEVQAVRDSRSELVSLFPQ